MRETVVCFQIPRGTKQGREQAGDTFFSIACFASLGGRGGGKKQAGEKQLFHTWEGQHGEVRNSLLHISWAGETKLVRNSFV